MHITTNVRADCTVVQLAGRLDLSAVAEVRRTLLKIMASQPVAVVGDLRDVSSVDPACSTVFPASWRESGGWPGVSLSLCSVSPQVQARLRAEGTSRFVPVHDDVVSALDAARALPPYVSQTTHLRFDLQAARDARRCTRATFALWNLDSHVDDGLLLVSEMVSNCVRHGAPPLRLTLRLRGGLLRIAVNDGGKARPRPHLRSVTDENVIDGVLITESGRGLPLVEAVATAWGVSDYADGPGKTVWCEMHVGRSLSRQPEPRPPAARRRARGPR